MCNAVSLVEDKDLAPILGDEVSHLYRIDILTGEVIRIAACGERMEGDPSYSTAPLCKECEWKVTSMGGKW